MTTNGVSNVEDADMAECDGEKVVTMMDVLQEEQDFEDDANAVLGASDEKNCTYTKGYIKRQALYACLTCCTDAKDDPTKRAGVCLACSLNCHENHELIELYTKRNFRCDCGNPKFNSHSCQYTSNKNDLNEDNNYNQNFSGLYCICHRPYPDPESPTDDEEMIQCIICEDWLHASHLDAAVPGIDQYSEMVCKACMEKNEFLHDYSHLTVNIETQDVDVIGINGTDTKLINGDVSTENLVNGSKNSSIDATENMDVDKAQIEDKSSKDSDQNMENSTSQIPVEASKENAESDVIMEPEITEEVSESSSDVNIDSKKDLKTDITAEDTPQSSEETEGSTTVPEDKPEETAQVNVTPEETTEVIPHEEATKGATETGEDISEPEESKETIPEKAETSSINQEEDTKKQEDNIDPSRKPEEATELSENKDATKNNLGNDTENNLGNDNDETLKSDSDDTTANQEEITSLTTADGIESITNSADNDNEINNSNKESPAAENTDLPQETNKADMETDNISSDIALEPEIINKESETPTDFSNDYSKAEEPNQTEIKIEEIKEIKRKFSTEENVASNDYLVKKPKLNEETCIRPKGVKRVHKGATFWPSNLRQKLCTCSECLSMYKDLSVLFLIDPEDTVFAYETLGKERVDGRATQYEKGLAALSSLDRIQQINALTEYNKMKDKLLDFLKSFKDRKEVVKEEDIKAFFAGMKPKREPDGVYFCR